MTFGKKQDYKLVGYVSKAGKLANYKQVIRVPDKYNEGKFRIKLETFSEDPVSFWVDEERVVAPKPQSEEDWKKAEKKRCWECGCQFTYRDCKDRDGDWSSDYCGC